MIVICVWFKVIICLYLRFNNKERSLFILMVVSVSKDIEYSIFVVISVVFSKYW